MAGRAPGQVPGRRGAGGCWWPVSRGVARSEARQARWLTHLRAACASPRSLQAKVFQLARDDGHPTGKVIKINHGDIGSKMLNNNVVRCWIQLLVPGRC